MTPNGNRHGRTGTALHPAPRRAAQPRDWRKRISDNLAYGLLVYTGLQIFVTMKQLKELSGTMLPYMALIVLVGGIIPAARMLERHWDKLDDIHAFDPAEAPRFARDRAIIWAAAIGLPFLLALIAKALHSLT
ncbi:hypothetical protein [Croceicoccus naphthovorans]|uniref:Uncharacterized protein n=2 Tax=Croceicoccus naphthovorans TaxID=1348774 RepID=A0A0G3XJJ9_9SPHN|nr:hypothetical protein [Croceicoccus naphthovorans]AKM11387.1 hypothetical protein AB433_00185 [Croceicoccus naphthovorans]